MENDRIDYYKKLEELRGSKLLVYITGDRNGLETQISSEVLDYFMDHLDLFNLPKKISLYLYTCGGNTLAAWSIVNLLRMFCEEFEVIVPSKALSSGTLICLGADSIIMTKQATLGPIDPSVNTPLNPQVPGAPPTAKVPVSVEAIKGFIALAKEEVGIEDDKSLADILIKLAENVHPLVLGEVYRARTQIQMLARRLLINQVTDVDKIDAIISFLCSDSGSHDYTINRREAKTNLGLKVINPDAETYKVIKQIYDDIRSELELNTPYDPRAILGSNDSLDYEFKRCIIESIEGGKHVFLSKGTLTKTLIQLQPNVSQISIQDNRTFEGWHRENETI